MKQTNRRFGQKPTFFLGSRLNNLAACSGVAINCPALASKSLLCELEEDVIAWALAVGVMVVEIARIDEKAVMTAAASAGLLFGKSMKCQYAIFMTKKNGERGASFIRIESVV